MAVNPATIGILTSALGSLFGGGGGGGGATGPQPVNAFTPQMAQQAFNYANKFGKSLEGFYSAPSYAPGGVTTTQATNISPQQAKAKEYATYLVNIKGFTPENAQKQVNKVIATKKTFADDKGFKDYIKQGNVEGFQVQGGKIKAPTKVQAGGANVSPQSEALRSGIGNLGLESISASAGLPGLFAQDTARSLGVRGGLTNAIQSLLGQGFNQEGLIPSEESNLDNLKNKYLQDFGNLFNDTTRNVVGGLADSGFSSSSLASDALQRGAFDTQSRFLTDALSNLSAQEETLKTGRFGRQSQNLTNLLNSFNTLGNNQGLGSILSGIVNPSSAGLFTDPQSAQFAGNLQQQNISNRASQNQLETGILGQPVTLMGDQPGFFSNLFSNLAPGIGIGAAYGLTRPKTATSKETSAKKI